MDRDRLASECLEIEKDGGNVLQFLKEKGFYSPWGTWYRLQKEELGRKDHEIKNGKGDEKMKKLCRLTNEQREEAVMIAIAGGDPKAYIEQFGAKDPQAVWGNIKAMYKEKHPELYAQIPKYVSKSRKLPDVVKATVKKEKAAEKLQLQGGKDYELSVAEMPESVPIGGYMEVTDVQEPEMPKITKPVNFGGYEVTAIRHPVFGEFHRNEKHDCIYWMSPDGEEVGMTPTEWIRFGLCIPDILGVLGVQV